MKNDEMQTLSNSIQEKLGKENSALIADELGRILTNNSQMNTEIQTRDDKIQKLTQDKENLITTNGNLLQQISMGEDLKEKQNNIDNKEQNKPKASSFDYKSVFDEKGHFKN